MVIAPVKPNAYLTGRGYSGFSFALAAAAVSGSASERPIMRRGELLAKMGLTAGSLALSPMSEKA
jgi:hypothetical protein